MKRLEVRTHSHTQFVDLTKLIHDLIRAERWSEGRMTLFVPHTTAGITIQENADPDVLDDLELCLDRMVPWKDSSYRHCEGNTAAHMKASMMGASSTLILEGGRVQLGRWQAVYFCEFDGPRQREVWVDHQAS
jgi:secondary thiamine-phosphate synthase enzyme